MSEKYQYQNASFAVILAVFEATDIEVLSVHVEYGDKQSSITRWNIYFAFPPFTNLETWFSERAVLAFDVLRDTYNLDYRWLHVDYRLGKGPCAVFETYIPGTSGEFPF